MLLADASIRSSTIEHPAKSPSGLKPYRLPLHEILALSLYDHVGLELTALFLLDPLLVLIHSDVVGPWFLLLAAFDSFVGLWSPLLPLPFADL